VDFRIFYKESGIMKSGQWKVRVAWMDLGFVSYGKQGITDTVNPVARKTERF
jgi:hypothetical protein